MARSDAPPPIDRPGLDAAFSALERRGYLLVGPTVRDRAIVLDEIVGRPAGPDAGPPPSP